MRNADYGTLLILLAQSVLAEPVRYTPDRWHTRVYFTLSHMGLSDYTRSL